MAAFDPEDPELQEDLELACLDLMRGDPPGRLLASRLKRACDDVLRRHGHSDAVVHATSNRTATAVRIRLPAPDKTVREVVLRLA